MGRKPRRAVHAGECAAKPAELFDAHGTPVPEIRGVAPTGTKRLGATPYVNGGVLRRTLKLPDFRTYGVEVTQSGHLEVENARPLGVFLRDVMQANTVSTSRTSYTGSGLTNYETKVSSVLA
jgi:xylulose-5-phosphate/fructose-6-phosphate phosphoketolase